MAKEIVAYKADGSIAHAPIANKPVWLAHSNRLPKEQQWRFEEMEEEEAAKLPLIDPNFKTPEEARKKATQLEIHNTQLSDENQRLIEEMAALKQQLEAQQKQATPTAEQVIEKINAATNKDDVAKLLGTDQRKTVQDAANKKISSFQ